MQLANTSFDEILYLTADVFSFYSRYLKNPIKQWPVSRFLVTE